MQLQQVNWKLPKLGVLLVSLLLLHQLVYGKVDESHSKTFLKQRKRWGTEMETKEKNKLLAEMKKEVLRVKKLPWKK